MGGGKGGTRCSIEPSHDEEYGSEGIVIRDLCHIAFAEDGIGGSIGNIKHLDWTTCHYPALFSEKMERGYDIANLGVLGFAVRSLVATLGFRNNIQHSCRPTAAVGASCPLPPSLLNTLTMPNSQMPVLSLAPPRMRLCNARELNNASIFVPTNPKILICNPNLPNMPSLPYQDDQARPICRSPIIQLTGPESCFDWRGGCVLAAKEASGANSIDALKGSQRIGCIGIPNPEMREVKYWVRNAFGSRYGIDTERFRATKGNNTAAMTGNVIRCSKHKTGKGEGIGDGMLGFGRQISNMNDDGSDSASTTHPDGVVDHERNLCPRESSGTCRGRRGVAALASSPSSHVSKSSVLESRIWMTIAIHHLVPSRTSLRDSTG